MSEKLKLYANLHLHSIHSDGAYTPEYLAEVAYNEGYKAIALTDHDTVTGNAPLRAACEKYGMECIGGIEFSTKQGWHMTAFHFDAEESELKEYLRQLSESETHQTKILFDRGVKIGYIKDITWQDVLDYNEGISWLCNEHVFRAMKARDLITDLEYPDFFETLFGKYRSEVPALYEWKSAEDIIRLVRNAGGIIFHAHPHRQLKHIEHLVEVGLSGVEVFHGMLSGEEMEEAFNLAKKYNLYVSGGSDHEGLCGGEYERYEHPEETTFWLDPTTAGTTQFFFNEIRDMKKHPDRVKVIDEIIESGVLKNYAGWHK